MRDKSQKTISKIWPGSKWYITCHGCCLIWGPKLFFPCQVPLFSIHFWNVQWAIPPSVPWRLVAHFVTTVLICFSLKAKTNTSKTHSLAADITISPSFPQSHHLYTSPQLSTDIRALWSTDALVWLLSWNPHHSSHDFLDKMITSSALQKQFDTVCVKRCCN